MRQKLTTTLLLCIALVLAIYFVAIAFCMRPAGDDLPLLALLREKGFAGSVAHNFLLFNFRHIPLLVFNSLFSLLPPHKAYTLLLPLFYLSLLIILVISCTFIFKQLDLSAFITRQLRLAYAVIFTGTLYFNTFQAIEVWTYLTDILYYLMPFIFSVAALAVIISPVENYSFLKNSLLVICALVAGSGVENYSFGLLLFLVCFMIYRYKITADFFKNTIDQRVLIFFVSLLVSSLVVYLAPGTHNRPAIESQFIVQEHTSAVATFSALWLQKKNLVALVFLLLWLAASSTLTIKQISTLKKTMLWSGILTVIFLLLTLYISQRVFHGYIPARSWFAFNFSLTVFFISVLLFICKTSSQLAKPIALCMCMLVFFVVNVYNFIHVPRLFRFASAYDARVEQMLRFKQKAAVLYLAPLPSPGVTLFNELSTDTAAFTNKITEAAYSLDASIALKQK